MLLADLLAKPFALSLSGGGARAAYLAGAVAELVEVTGVLSRARVVYGASGGAIVASQFALSACARDRRWARELPETWLRAADPLVMAAGLPAIGGLGLPGWIGVAACAARTILGGTPAQTERPWGLDAVLRANMRREDWRILTRGAARATRPVDFGVVVCSTSGERRLVSTMFERDPETLHRAVMATASIPGVFPPVEVWPGEWFVDGCVVDFNPTSLILESDVAGQVEGIISLNVTPVEEPAAPLRRAVRSVGERISLAALGARETISGPPVLRLGPPAPLSFGPLDFDPVKMAAAIRLGRETVLRALSPSR